MARPGTVIGWKLDRAERASLLERFPPAYAEVVADHVTLAVKPGAERPAPVRAVIVGRADDGDGVECYVVTIDGTADRPDGSTYHITWSLGPGRTARESNDVLKAQGWQELDHPVPVPVAPARF
ncbi:hypothetical protein HMF7854_08715 [Sphingomonas ginkgonis]|uniref:Uncharacterized protein n=1 Tax=Sphingomonas ginkgonis TaxID=2315330 RepID=A0A429VA95_9SPHN|nr:hypothetical protein [Sphingomonas ginkgonis]RST30913.1 hypothetical protein HMF7854_08715 [Sphingomonas ginkgonis]